MMLNMALFNVGASAGAGLGGILLAAGGYSTVGIVLAFVGILSALLAWSPGRPGVTPARR
jgi:predicted MFS family arabinose efflux permease